MTLHRFVVTLFARNINAETTNWSLDVALDHGTKVLENEFERVATRRHVTETKTEIQALKKTKKTYKLSLLNNTLT